MDGVSLLPVFMGETPPAREFITAEECTWQRKWAIRTDTEKLILSRAPDFHGRPRREYFDLATDPDELRDLSTERPDRADALEARLEDWIAEMVARNGLPGDPLLTEDITLGKKWEEWLNAGGAEARE
jgi:arylsulfatase A-like enzyme